MAEQKRYHLDFAYVSWNESRAASEMQVKAQRGSRPISKQIGEGALASLPQAHYEALVIPTPLETRWMMFELLCLAEENRKLFSGEKNAVFRKERVHRGPVDFTAGGQRAIFLCSKYLQRLYDL